MYKKTTTTTTTIEEHDDAPVVESSPVLGSIFTEIPNENTDLGISTRLNLRNYYSLYAIYMREYANIVYNKQPTTGIKSSVANHATAGFVSAISPWVTSPVVPQVSIDALVASSTMMAESLCNVVDAIVNMKDRDISIQAAKKAIADFSTNLNNIVYLFQKEKIGAMLESYLSSIISQIDYKISGEWNSDSASYYTGFEELASAPVPGTTPFADVISNGFIQWQPWRFT